MNQGMPNFEVFFKQVTETIPKSFLNLHQDFEKNLRIALETALRRLNLVTREEFEVQSAVLERTRARLEALEAQVAVLESILFSQTQSDSAHSSIKPNPSEDTSNLSK